MTTLNKCRFGNNENQNGFCVENSENLGIIYCVIALASVQSCDGEFTYRRVGHAPSHMLVWNPVTSKFISKFRVICLLYD